MTASLDQDTIFAAGSPAGFGFVATRGDAEPYVPQPFHLKIAEGLVDIEQGRLELLVIQVPVQHGKTLTASIWGTAWILGLHPTWPALLLTYNTDFAEDRLGRPTRDILERHGARFFGVHVDPRSRSMKRWNTTHGGGLVAAGVDKPVTGRPSKYVGIDDPYPDLKHAMNPDFRAEVVDWLRANVLTRRADPMRMVAIMSRWHEDDFIAWLIKHAQSAGWNYRVLDFPAIAICRVEGCDAPRFRIERAEDGSQRAVMDLCDHRVRDELGRLPGEALWPQVRPIEFLLRQYIDVTPRMFYALFQGRPQPAGGSMFRREWFRYFRRVGDVLELLEGGQVVARYPLQTCKVFQIVDLAAGDTQTLRSGITRTKAKSDYTVIGTFALCPRKELAVLDIYRDNRIQGPDQMTMIGNLRARYGAGRIGVEAVQYQWTAVQAAARMGLPVVPITRGNESKETRAWAISTRYEISQVFHLLGAPWVDDLETELVAFPNGRHDDQVDVLSDAGAVVSEAATTATPQGVYVA